MTDRLRALIAQTRGFQMDEAQKREQRLSFVYGNTHIENARITRDIVVKADNNVRREDSMQVLRML